MPEGQRRVRTAALLRASAGFVLLATCLWWGCGGPPMPPYAPSAPSQVSPEGPIVVLGDTQRTTWEEVLLLWREQNEAARLALIQKIAAEEQPAFVVHLGDMVESGGTARNWEYFDRL